MYRPRYLSLAEAVEIIAEKVAVQSAGQSDLEDARGLLIRALYEGVIRSEGVFQEPPVEPDPSESVSVIPPKKTEIPRNLWRNEKFRRALAVQSTTWPTNSHTDQNGYIITNLDAIIVNWDQNYITWEEEYGDYGYEDVAVVASDLDTVFQTPSDAGEAETQTTTGDRGVGEASLASDEVIYSTGAPGRPSSMHLLEPELRRRFEAGELLPTMKQEAEYLSRWLKIKHPLAAPLTPKSIRNQLGALYRQLKGPDPKMKSSG